MRERLGQVALCQSHGGGGYDFNEEELNELRGKLRERVLRIAPPPYGRSFFSFLGDKIR